MSARVVTFPPVRVWLMEFKYVNCPWMMTQQVPNGAGNTYFNIQTLTFGSGASAAHSLTALGDGWVRFKSQIAVTAGNQGLTINMTNGNGVPVYTGTSRTVEIRNVQIDVVGGLTTAERPFFTTTGSAKYGPRFDYDSVRWSRLGC